MSANNGDKSRFGRLRKQKIRNRKRIRDFRNARILAAAEAPAPVPRIQS